MNITKPEVGTKMLFVKNHCDEPIETTVTRVTKTGQIYVEANPLTRYKSHYNGSGYEFRTVSDGYDRSRVYSMSVLPRLQEQHAAKEREIKDRRERQAKEDAARKERDARELAELRQAMPNIQYSAVSFGESGRASKQPLPDGSRLYTVNMPVREQDKERKKGFEVMIVRCQDEIDELRDGASRVVASYTSCNGNTQSFASCSSARYGSDEEALWDCAKYLYHRGW